MTYVLQFRLCNGLKTVAHHCQLGPPPNLLQLPPRRPTDPTDNLQPWERALAGSAALFWTGEKGENWKDVALEFSTVFFSRLGTPYVSCRLDAGWGGLERAA